MDIRFANSEEVENWNKHILANPDGGNIFQGYELAEHKKLGGWTPRYLMANKLAITVHEKPVFGLGKLWYLPKGPGITTVRQLDKLLPQLRRFAEAQGVFLIKIEPELIKKDETLADLLKLGLIKARPIQPNFSTILVDISPDLETVLTRLNQKGRHAIRRAERDGVTVKEVEATDENCRIMYDLFVDTAARASFQVRDYSYHKSFWQRYAKAGLGQLFFAYVEGKVVASAFAVAYGKKGTYKDGASIRERTVYGASHLLQWHVIQWMKTKGITVHDLGGSPPSDQINNPDHKWYGVGRFKTNFNKEVTDYVGAYDIVIKPFAYNVWQKYGERIALRLHTALHHESYY